MRIHRCTALIACSLMLALVACAPSVEVEGPRTSVYRGNPEQVFSTILRAISTMPIPKSGDGFLAERPSPSGWQITESDRAGGFLRTQISVERTFGSGFETYIDSISFVVSPAGNQQSSVVFQSVPTELANDLLAVVRTNLQQDFGTPITTDAVVPN